MLANFYDGSQKKTKSNKLRCGLFIKQYSIESDKAVKKCGIPQAKQTES